jgi:CheY-like chemotaxis protein
MPRMDGLQATRHFRTWEQQRQPAPPLLPMFALSANVRVHCSQLVPLRMLRRFARTTQVFEEKEAECSDAGLDGAPLSLPQAAICCHSSVLTPARCMRQAFCPSRCGWTRCAPRWSWPTSFQAVP